MNTTDVRKRVARTQVRCGAAVVVLLLAASAAAKHTPHSAPPAVIEERPAAAPADSSDARVAWTSSDSSNVALSGRVLLPDGTVHTGDLYAEIGFEPNPHSGFKTWVRGTCSANGDFAVTAWVPCLASGGRIDLRLCTAPTPDGLHVSIVAADVLHVARSFEVARAEAEARFEIALGDVALVLPEPIATIVVHADATHTHVLAIEPHVWWNGMALDPVQIEVVGERPTPVYSFEHWDEWRVACPVAQLVGRFQVFERGDEVTAELLQHLRVTGTAELATIPARSIVMIVDRENFRPPEECRVETLVDVCMRTFGRSGVWFRCESVREDGSIPTHDMVPGDYVIEVWPPSVWGDDLTVEAPAPLATLHVEFDAEHTTYALK